MKEKIKKGTVIEVEVPNVKHPIKAVVLDTTEFDYENCIKGVSLICYAQKKLFKMFCAYAANIKLDDNQCVYTEYEYFGLKYKGIIMNYCEIPCIQDI